MTTIRNHKSRRAHTRLMPFVLALMLIFAGVATTGCDTLDSNAPIETERVLTLVPVESVAPQVDEGGKSTAPADEYGDSVAADNPVKDYSTPSADYGVLSPPAYESCVRDKKGGHFTCGLDDTGSPTQKKSTLGRP